MTLVEYPAEKSAPDGTAITDAVCPKGHGKARNVASDALKVKGAIDAIALRCWTQLSDAERKKTTGVPHEARESLPSKEFSPGATAAAVHDDRLCQEYLVPVESYDDGGRLIRRNGKKLDKPAETKASKRRANLKDEDGGERVPVGGAYQGGEGDTGGEKLARASGSGQTRAATEPKKARTAKRSKAAKGRKR